jgi:hypothetical protein
MLEHRKIGADTGGKRIGIKLVPFPVVSPLPEPGVPRKEGVMIGKSRVSKTQVRSGAWSVYTMKRPVSPFIFDRTPIDGLAVLKIGDHGRSGCADSARRAANRPASIAGMAPVGSRA